MEISDHKETVGTLEHTNMYGDLLPTPDLFRESENIVSASFENIWLPRVARASRREGERLVFRRADRVAYGVSMCDFASRPRGGLNRNPAVE
jgi:hypothetical protein